MNFMFMGQMLEIHLRDYKDIQNFLSEEIFLFLFYDLQQNQVKKFRC